MGIDRRKFLTLAGLTVATAVGKKTLGDSMIDHKSNMMPKDESLVGKRWAMVIDVKKCLHKEGCTVCMDACHHIHNVPDFGNKKDEIKWIWKEPFEHALPENESHYLKEEYKESDVIVMCNHCDNPPCVQVCPTQATFKREDGIVMMDMHRCIGCRYCVAGCPYGSRSFNWRDPRPFINEMNPEYPTRERGVVEKCNFCAERLAVGLQPSCVEACPEKALHFGDLEDPDSDVRQILKDNFTIRRKPGLGTSPQVYYLV